MRSLAGRVKRIEKRLAEPGGCVCGGPHRVQIRIEGRPEPEACKRCGSWGKVIDIVRAEPPPDWPYRDDDPHDDP